MARRVARVAAIAGEDPGGRGIAPLVAATGGELEAAARSLAEHPAPHVALLTGFYIPGADPPAAETDGPVGAAHLASGLRRAGVPARLVTDAPCAGAVRAAARAAGVEDAVEVVRTEDDVAALLAGWAAVSHVVAVERVGPAADGVCRNMRGDDVSAHTAPLDRLFGADRVRIGIGDGGNELGMGRLPRELVAASVTRGERIGCVVGCEHLIVAGTSNWGALALQVALALVRDDWRAALTAELTPQADRRILAAMVAEGPAVDGVLGRPSLSVDGLAWETNADVLSRLLATLP